MPQFDNAPLTTTIPETIAFCLTNQVPWQSGHYATGKDQAEAESWAEVFYIENYDEVYLEYYDKDMNQWYTMEQGGIPIEVPPDTWWVGLAELPVLTHVG
jgi:hypothetical protein